MVNYIINKLAIKYEKTLHQLRLMTLNQRILLILISSIFFPTPLSATIMISLVIYLIYMGELSRLIKKFPEFLYLFLFLFICVIGAIIHFNMYGFWLIIGMALLQIIIIMFYKDNFSNILLDLVIKVSTAMSLFCAIIGITQFLSILRVDKKNLLLMIDNKPEERVTSFFINANFYAFIIELIVIMTLYKLMILKRNNDRIYYFFIMIINLLMLYLTGCRSAWIALFIALTIMLLFSKFKKEGMYLFFSEIIVILSLIITKTFPRINSLEQDLKYRMEIWNYCFNFMKEHCLGALIGIGPQGYSQVVMLEYSKAPPAIHAHSVYIETLLCGGIIGIIILLIGLGIYLVSIAKNYYQTSFILVIGSLIVLLIHGIFDVPTMEHQTGLLFGIIFTSIKTKTLVKKK